MYPSRQDALRQGQEAVRIMLDGKYVAPSGAEVSLRDDLDRAKAGTVSYSPSSTIPARAGAPHPKTVFEATNESTLSAARRLRRAGLDPVALNFASAKNPGGGFQNGARAQEESLCRASGLFACIDGDPMYEHHRRNHDPVYASWAIYSPRVPVFRADDGALLEEPWPLAFITSPAPNAKVARERSPDCGDAIARALRERVWRVLRIAAAHGHDAAVLGAWGCGVFGNDGDAVAALFDEALQGELSGAFAHVVFAVLDSSPEQRFLGPFARRFAR